MRAWRALRAATERGASNYFRGLRWFSILSVSSGSRSPHPIHHGVRQRPAGGVAAFKTTPAVSGCSPSIRADTPSPGRALLAGALSGLSMRSNKCQILTSRLGLTLVQGGGAKRSACRSPRHFMRPFADSSKRTCSTWSILKSAHRSNVPVSLETATRVPIAMPVSIRGA